MIYVLIIQNSKHYPKGSANKFLFFRLRHTHISVLLYKGVSIQFISERADHKDIETTLKYYSQVLKEMRIEKEEKSVRIMTSMHE
ncbi:tyrosine-type recombinase/integrase [Sporosarcina sp. JAI121]|uniref:tyrosine-type recombinase/integrase n=1 Tax=Sporosarcina sp. JAI121 TaxID=2723064 RepID=UPI0015CBF307|nr:tyrosine-type recombinase/integrase [Sporosarcina sp. JAI121]